MEAHAKRLGATELVPSWRAGKKWAVKYKGRYIHFGAKGYEDFSQHGDPVRRASYRRRHVGILLAPQSLQGQNIAGILGLSHSVVTYLEWYKLLTCLLRPAALAGSLRSLLRFFGLVWLVFDCEFSPV